MSTHLNTTSTCSEAVNLGRLYCGILTYPMQMYIALSLLATLIIFIMGLCCIQKDQPNQIARQLRILNDREAARLEREAAERADDLDDAARDAEDARLRAELGPGGIGQFPVPAAPNGIAMFAEEQARRQRQDSVLSDSSTVWAIAREGLFAGGSSPAQRNVNPYHIDGIEMDDLADRGRDEGLRGR